MRSKTLTSPRSKESNFAADKVPTGIAGFDQVTRGGLPRGRTSLLLGGPGSGKTIFALQFLMHGARHCQEPGIFVAFEEHSKRIIANSHGFGWDLPGLQPKSLAFVDAQPTVEFTQTGDFDICGMLATFGCASEIDEAPAHCF